MGPSPDFAPEDVVCSEQVLLPVFLALTSRRNTQTLEYRLEAAANTDAGTIARACCTCRAFREVGSSNAIWKELFKRVFPRIKWSPHVASEDDRYLQTLFKESVLRIRDWGRMDLGIIRSDYYYCPSFV